MAVAGALAILLGALSVEGSSTCPLPADVAARAQALGVSPPAGSERRATLDPEGSGIRIRLTDVNGTTLGEHLLPAAPCADLAQAAAVLLSVWEARLHAAEPPPAPAPAASPAPAPAVETPPRPRPRREPMAMEAGIGLAAGVDSVGLTFGAQLMGSLTPGRLGFGADVSVAALGVRDVDVDGVTVHYQRYPIGLGLHYRLLGDPVRLDLQARADAAMLVVSDETSNPQTYRSVDFGASAGARAEAALGPLWIWFSVCLTAWPGRQTLSVTGFADTRVLPLVEFLFVEGVAFGG
jgi:hypothetical protein